MNEQPESGTRLRRKSGLFPSLAIRLFRRPFIAGPVSARLANTSYWPGLSLGRRRPEVSGRRELFRCLWRTCRERGRSPWVRR